MRVEAERESSVEGGRHQMSRALSARLRNLDVNLRAMGSHGRIIELHSMWSDVWFRKTHNCSMKDGQEGQGWRQGDQ